MDFASLTIDWVRDVFFEEFFELSSDVVFAMRVRTFLRELFHVSERNGMPKSAGNCGASRHAARGVESSGIVQILIVLVVFVDVFGSSLRFPSRRLRSFVEDIYCSFDVAVSRRDSTR